MKSSFKVDWIPDQATAQRIASEFDLVITWNEAAIPWLKQVNPNITVLRYIPYAVIYSDQAEFIQAQTEGWILKDAAGELVHSLLWTTLYLCNPNNSGFQAYFANYCRQRAAEGFDGIFLDGGTSVALQTTDILQITANPVNPATGQIWTHQELTDARATLNRLAKTAVGSKLCIGNGLMSSADLGWYAEAKVHYQTLLNSVDGAMIEYIVISPWEGFFRSIEHWLADLDVIKWHTSQKKSLLWSGTTMSNASASAMYIYASYLMGTANMDNMINCIQSETVYAEDPFVLSLYKLDIGVPLAPFTKVGNHYERQFTNTSVYVNPTDIADLVILDAEYILLTTGERITSLTIQAHTGYVLKRVTPVPPPPPPPSGCFIATACYGSPTHYRVNQLRSAKNTLTARSRFARLSYRLYYVFSPSVARKIVNMQRTKKAIRSTIEFLWKLGRGDCE